MNSSRDEWRKVVGSFLEFVGVVLLVVFVWAVCGMWWGILAMAIVLIALGNAIDRGAARDDSPQAGQSADDGTAG